MKTVTRVMVIYLRRFLVKKSPWQPASKIPVLILNCHSIEVTTVANDCSTESHKLIQKHANLRHSLKDRKHVKASKIVTLKSPQNIQHNAQKQEILATNLIRI